MGDDKMPQLDELPLACTWWRLMARHGWHAGARCLTLD
jgi:hypothetical protein